MVKTDPQTQAAYRCWKHMRQRCFNPRSKDFKHYGGRGISVCKRWARFENFLKDMGPRPSLHHSIERRDNGKDYRPSNCYWATRKEQGRNTRSVKLNLEKVAEIRSLCEYGFDQRQIAKWAGVAPQTVSGIFCGDIWV